MRSVRAGPRQKATAFALSSFVQADALVRVPPGDRRREFESLRTQHLVDLQGNTRYFFSSYLFPYLDVGAVVGTIRSLTIADQARRVGGRPDHVVVAARFG